VQVVYVICPLQLYQPALPAWVTEAMSTVVDELQLEGWRVQLLHADESNGFNFLDVFSIVAERIGPVLILGKLKSSSIAGLQSKLDRRCTVVVRRDVDDSTDIYDALTTLMNSHAAGDPQLPIRLVAAVQIIRKLKRHGYWGGESLNKNFLWGEDLPKGGMSRAVQPICREVAAELVQKGLLKSKPSKNRVKFALNGDRVADLDALLRLEIPDRALEKYLNGGGQTLSARELDDVRDDD